MLLPATRRRLEALIPTFRSESPVHAVAAGFYILVLVQMIGSQVAVDQLRALGGRTSAPSPLWFILGTNQLPMAIVAIVGVGIFIRRSPRQAMRRLGLVWPGWRWIGASLLVAVGLVIFAFGWDWLMLRLTPDQSRAIQEVSNNLLKNVNSVATVVALGIGAGIGEELLFRGALLPRFGNLLAALLFAAFHVQYAVSLATLEILILGLVLGLLRRRAGTTGAIVAHAGYDIIVGMLSLLPR
jgi:membrane protease YdiL (CAAX protease family)